MSKKPLKLLLPGYANSGIALGLLFFAIGSVSAKAQASTDYGESISRFDASLGYNYVRANAPPAGCDCFGMNGGYASAGMRIKGWLGLEAEITGQHANDISALGQNLTLLTFAAGPRVQWGGRRLVPFGQVLVGGAHGSDSYFPTGNTSTTSASSFALQTGGGLQLVLTNRVGLRLIDAEYLRTQLPNGTGNEQNHLMIGAGIVFRFNHVRHAHLAPPPPPAPGQIALNCSSNVANIDQGDTLEITGNAITQPANLPVAYTWTSSVGTIAGVGGRVELDTQGVPPGDYHVTGHAATTGAQAVSADCDVAFRIRTPAEAVANPIPAPEATAVISPGSDREFHQNVPDILFDFDSAAIRPDAQPAIEREANYLLEHPDIRVLIGGYADDRGSAEYNLQLGQERAAAARKALIAAGVQPERLEIVSYGKSVQVCTEDNEACRQQNRRAAFTMHR